MNTDKGRRKKLFQLGKDRSLVGAPNFPALIRLRIWVHLRPSVAKIPFTLAFRLAPDS